MASHRSAATADLNFLKDYVVCHGTAPEHTTSYGRRTFHQQDEGLTDWKDKFEIKIVEIAEDDMVFDMSGIDVAFANAFRRILQAEVPTMAIEKVFVRNNTGVLRDELLAHRLGLIPIKADPSRFDWPSKETKKADHTSPLNENEVLKFKLHVKCRKPPAGGQEPINGKVLSSALEWVPIGGQEAGFVSDRPEPVSADILVARLRPGQELELEAHCHKGSSLGERGHAKWSPVATAWYRLLPRIDLVEEVTGPLAEALVSKCASGCFEIEDLGAPAPARRARVSDKERDCTLCRECVREPALASKVRVARAKAHFIFSVESTGILPPAELFRQSVSILRSKAAGLLDALEQLEGTMAVDAMEADGNDDEDEE